MCINNLHTVRVLDPCGTSRPLEMTMTQTSPKPTHGSPNAFRFELEQIDDVIGVTGQDVKETLRRTRFPISSCKPHRVFDPPKFTCGKLDNLPLEILQEVCRYMNLWTLFNLRRANRRARDVVNSVREYRILATKDADLFRVLLIHQERKDMSLIDLYDLACSPTCSMCKKGFGNLLYLPLWIRCCTICKENATSESSLDVVTVNSVKRKLHIPARFLEDLPIIKMRPGPTARRAWQVTPLRDVITAYKSRYNRSPGPYLIDSLHSKIRFNQMAFCRFPCYDPETRQFQNGVWCKGCAQQGRERTLYTYIGFVEHLLGCPEARQLWVREQRNRRGTLQKPANNQSQPFSKQKKHSRGKKRSSRR